MYPIIFFLFEICIVLIYLTLYIRTLLSLRYYLSVLYQLHLCLVILFLIITSLEQVYHTKELSQVTTYIFQILSN